jgi:hypothetical protein
MNFSSFEEPKMNRFVWKIRDYRKNADTGLVEYHMTYLNFFQTNPRAQMDQGGDK